MSNRPLRILRTYTEFVLSRLLGTGVDTFVLWVCSYYLFDSYIGDYILSPFISFEFAVMSNFLCSYFWIWRTRIDHRSWKNFWSRFFIFNLSSVAGFVVKMLLPLIFKKKSSNGMLSSAGWIEFLAGRFNGVPETEGMFQ